MEKMKNKYEKINIITMSDSDSDSEFDEYQDVLEKINNANSDSEKTILYEIFLKKCPEYGLTTLKLVRILNNMDNINWVYYFFFIHVVYYKDFGLGSFNAIIKRLKFKNDQDKEYVMSRIEKNIRPKINHV